MPKGYKVLEGVTMADTAFEAEGKDLGELFEHCAMAVESVMVNLASVSTKTATTISLEQDTLEHLLYEFLSELVYLKDAEQLLFADIKVSVSKNTGWALHAQLNGDKISSKMRLGTDVKAITLHQFSVKEEKNVWTARFVVDV